MFDATRLLSPVANLFHPRRKSAVMFLRRNSFVLFVICSRSEALTPSQVVFSNNRTGWIKIGFCLVFRDGKAADAFVVAAATWLMYVGAVSWLAGRGAGGWGWLEVVVGPVQAASIRRRRLRRAAPRLGARFKSVTRMTAYDSHVRLKITTSSDMRNM